MTQFYVGFEILREQALFHPLQPVGAQRLGQTYGIVYIESHPTVEHKFSLVADDLTGVGHKFFVLADTVPTVGRAIGAGELEGFEAQFFVPIHVVAGDVAEHLVVRRAAE